MKQTSAGGFYMRPVTVVVCVALAVCLLLACSEPENSVSVTSPDTPSYGGIREDLRIVWPAFDDTVFISNDFEYAVRVYIPEDLREDAERILLYADYESESPFAVSMRLDRNLECCEVLTWGNELGYCAGCFFPALVTTGGDTVIGAMHHVWGVRP
jgi:hypothetical protein